MELDHVLMKDEWEELRKKNLCFHCKGEGHFSQDCPELKGERPKVNVRALLASLVEEELEEVQRLVVEDVSAEEVPTVEEWDILLDF
jgi:DnaJ-class molecular chaperone